MAGFRGHLPGHHSAVPPRKPAASATRQLYVNPQNDSSPGPSLGLVPGFPGWPWLHRHSVSTGLNSPTNQPTISQHSPGQEPPTPCFPPDYIQTDQSLPFHLQSWGSRSAHTPQLSPVPPHPPPASFLVCINSHSARRDHITQPHPHARPTPPVHLCIHPGSSTGNHWADPGSCHHGGMVLRHTRPHPHCSHPL